MNSKDWWKIVFEIDRNIEDIVVWKLYELKVYTYSFNYKIDKPGYFDLNVWLPSHKFDNKAREEFEKELINLLKDNQSKVGCVYWNLIKEEDWLNSWKKFWQPEPIGENLLVLPCWMELPEEYKDKNILKIDPGAAFGTGSHPSTALCLETVQEISMENKKVLDIGSGSGILTIAAKILGSTEQFAIDNDYLAVHATKENFRLNFANTRNFTVCQGTLTLLRKECVLENFDLVMCNILSEIIKPLIPEISLCCQIGGNIILSGILCSQKEEIIKILKLNSFRIDKVSSKEEWISILATKLN